ncbi:hypothetical protein FCULG_00008115 [Fusarium culmorum]|uniref:Uncharacterized protein n=1 Tax=Fusarium culmorum TaxID=5516 RepID=A0A2T4H0H5_FUSCU|nr:hypothetical protein FCULG_00008115 [Fusarium culmorum]
MSTTSINDKQYLPPNHLHPPKPPFTFIILVSPSFTQKSNVTGWYGTGTLIGKRGVFCVLLILILLLFLNDASVSKRCSLALRVCLGDVTAAKACDNHANAWGKKVSYQKDLSPDTIPRNLHNLRSHQRQTVNGRMPAETMGGWCRYLDLISLFLNIYALFSRQQTVISHCMFPLICRLWSNTLSVVNHQPYGA